MDNNNIFDGVAVFCAVVEEGSFTAAARALHHTTSHVSKEVARLEQRLGTRLMNRTTRKISLTETGRIFYDSSRQIIEDAQATQAQIHSTEGRPFGHLKVSVPVMFGDVCLNPWLPDFASEFSEVTLEIEISDRFADIIAEGFDVVVRVGQLEDTDFISKTLMTTRPLTVASPAYLDKYGTPLKPKDLDGHSHIAFSSRGSDDNWTYQDRHGKALSVTVKPKIRCNSAAMEIALAKSGFGITRIPHLACREEIAAGTLVAILQEYEKPDLRFHAVYPSRKYLTPKVRAFVDFLTQRCAAMTKAPRWSKAPGWTGPNLARML